MARKRIVASVAALPALTVATYQELPPALRRQISRPRSKSPETGGNPGGMSWEWVINFIAPLIAAIMPALSASLRDLLSTSLQKWKVAADKTTSPWDNWVIDFLARVLGVTLT